MIESPGLRPLRSFRWPRAHRLWIVGLVAMLAAGRPAMAQTPDTTRRILVLPALQWTATASTWQYAMHQNQNDLIGVMGLHFGMTPEEVGQHMTDRSSALHWSDLPEAKGFGQDVRYVYLPMQAAGALTGAITSCYGAGSSVVLLFLNKALFRVSWRLLADQRCPAPGAAADDVYATFVPLNPTIVASARYHTGTADVVDVTDPRAGKLVAQRWQMPGR